MVLLKKLLNSWFDEFFFQWERIYCFSTLWNGNVVIQIQLVCKNSVKSTLLILLFPAMVNLFFFKLLFILLAFWQKLVISNTCTSFEKVRQSKYQRIYAVSWFHENFEVVFKYLTNRFSHCVRFFYYYKRQIPVEETDEVSFCTIWELVRGHYWLFYKFVRNIVKLTVCFSSNHFIYLVYFVMFAQIGTFSFDSFRATSLLWLTIVSSAIRRPTPFEIEY